MKKYFIIATSVVTFSCGQSKDIQSTQEVGRNNLLESAELFAKTDLPYQQFAPSVKFFTPADLPGKTMYQLVDEQKQFIASSGLPTAENMVVWIGNHTLDDAITGYKAFKEESKDNKYFRSFRQYCSWMILTRLNLLGTNKTNDVAYFTNELVEAKYNGYGLLNYLLGTLENSGYNKAKISEWASNIVSTPDALTSSQAVDESNIQVNGVADFHAAKTRQDIIDFLKKRHNEHSVDLENIRKYVVTK